MFDVKFTIEKLSNEFNLELSISKELEKKQTARSLQKYILIDKSNKKYLLEIATNSIEIFYFNRTIMYQKKFSELKSDFKCNMPLFVQGGNKLAYAIYEYFDDIEFLKDEQPIELINNFYQNNIEEIELNDGNVEKILISFLSAWPNQYHSMIKRQKEFRKYKYLLEKMESVKVSFEHGDFTSNNIFKIEDKLYLMDFEFSRDFQPIGFDIFYNSFYDKKDKITYNKIHYYKLFLDYLCNYIVDNRVNNITIAKKIQLYIRFIYIYKEEIIHATS